VITAGDELERGQVVGNEFDHGPDELLTHHEFGGDLPDAGAGVA
jgi:hypothetical protein